MYLYVYTYIHTNRPLRSREIRALTASSQCCIAKHSKFCRFTLIKERRRL